MKDHWSMKLSLFHRNQPTTPCTCTHAATAHEHYRAGDDCGFATCSCLHYASRGTEPALVR